MEVSDTLNPVNEDTIWQFAVNCDLQTLEKLLKNTRIPSSNCAVEDLRLKLFHGMILGLIDTEEILNPGPKQTTSTVSSACLCGGPPCRRRRLKVGQYVTLDHPLQLDAWHSNIIYFPVINAQQISLYFKRRKAHGQGTHEVETLAAARRISVTSGRIRNVEHQPISDAISVCYVRGHVVPGPHTQHRPCLVWARIDKSSGAIQEAECTCQLGSNSGVCLHVLALLFHIANKTSQLPKKTEWQGTTHKELRHSSHKDNPSYGESEHSSDSFSDRDIDDLQEVSENRESTVKCEIPETTALGHRLLYHQQQPVVLCKATCDWSAASWTPDSLTELLNDTPLTFRIGNRQTTAVQWETSCDYESATIGEFVNWTAGGTRCGALSKYQPSTSWCYCDYKHMAHQFSHLPQLLQAVDWTQLGFPGRGGEKSTFWLGSPGAHTQCHYDSYGCNLVAQIYGRKRWVLFPPSDLCCLYPTRIPYEESSVFSNVNINNPNIQQHPKFKDTSPIVVTLEPGDVLYVPRHWWHDVTSLTTSISINTWLELPHDDEERVREAITRTLVMALMQDSDSQWLNPNEQLSSFRENIACLQASIQLSSQPPAGNEDTSQDSCHQLDTRSTECDTDAGRCTCSPSYPAVHLPHYTKHLPRCTFTHLQALVAREHGLDPPPSGLHSGGNRVKESLEVKLAESLSHPDVIQSIHKLIDY